MTAVQHGESQPTDEEIATAYHEAGHAVIALIVGRPVHRVSILPNQLRLGVCELKKGALRKLQDVLEAEILVLLGGLAAEARFRGKYHWQSAQKDLRMVRELVETRAASARQVDRLERRFLDKTEHLLGQEGHWAGVERLARELLVSKSISGRAAEQLFAEAIRSTKNVPPP